MQFSAVLQERSNSLSWTMAEPSLTAAFHASISPKGYYLPPTAKYQLLHNENLTGTGSDLDHQSPAGTAPFTVVIPM
jgi:hypothetical protein